GQFLPPWEDRGSSGLGLFRRPLCLKRDQEVALCLKRDQEVGRGCPHFPRNNGDMENRNITCYSHEPERASSHGRRPGKAHSSSIVPAHAETNTYSFSGRGRVLWERPRRWDGKTRK